MAEMAALLVLRKVGCLLFGGRGRHTSAVHRRKVIELIGICLRTLKRWRKAFLGDGDDPDRRNVSDRHVAQRLSEEEPQRILPTCNQPVHAAVMPEQIVPALADQKLFIG